MPIDASIYGQFAPPVRSPEDVQNGLARGAAAGLALQNQRMQVEQAQNVMQQRNGLAQAMQGGQFDLTNPSHQAQMVAQFPDVAPTLLKTVNEGTQSAAKAKLDTSQAADADQQAELRKIQRVHDQTALMAQQLSAAKSPADVIPIVTQHVEGGLLNRDKAIAEFDQMPKQPGPEFEAWKAAKLQQAVPVLDQMKQAFEQVKLKSEEQRAAATNQTSITNNTATNAAHLKGIGIQQGGENARAALARGTQLTIAGMNPDGTLNGNTEEMAKAIASGQVAPLTGFALARPAGQQVMARVMQLNPQYDATTFGAKAQAAKAFTSGKEAGLLRSIGTANKHLDMLGGMVDALGNGNIQVLNKLGQAYSQQTGNPAPTNFDSAKEIVGQEVVKSIVASGGGVQERQEAAAALSKAKSPAQLKGVIQTYRTIMGAQHESLLQQRDPAGLSRSTLPDYTEQAPASTGLPQGWKIEKVTK